MTDYSVVEFNTIEEQFPASLVYICDFHRLQSRQRWLRKSKHCLSQQEQDVIMRRLKEVAGAKTEDLFNVAVKELLGTPLVKQNADVCTYIEKMWLSCSFRWARAFRKHVVDNIVNTNNGVEAQNRVIKYSYLPHTIDKSVHGIVIMLVERYIPECFQEYQAMNMLLSGRYRRYNPMVPIYLHNRPPHFVKHCMKSKFSFRLQRH